MKTIIAGGRDFVPTQKDVDLLDSLLDVITEVVSGKAKGADSFGEDWARQNNISIKEFPAQWNNFDLPVVVRKVNNYGKEYNAAAGFCRNKQMAEYAEAVIIFKGGKGTNDMYQQAKECGLKVYDFRN